MSLAWLPNVLTIARCLLAGVVAWLIITQPPTSVWPFVAFVAVAMTDFIDGWAARRLRAVSEFGAFLDPVADKLLVGSSLVALSYLQAWDMLLLIPSLAIITRDLVATGLRLIPSIEMPVSRLAKWKTALEMIGIGALLAASPLAFQPIWTLGLIVIWLAAALSIYTLGLYVGTAFAKPKRPHL